MQIPLVMTLIGPDSTGLVEAVARAVADHGGNWLESRMCRLGGAFAGILRVEVPGEKKTALLEALQKISGLKVIVHAGEKKTIAANARLTSSSFPTSRATNRQPASRAISSPSSRRPPMTTSAPALV